MAIANKHWCREKGAEKLCDDKQRVFGPINLPAVLSIKAGGANFEDKEKWWKGIFLV